MPPKSSLRDILALASSLETRGNELICRCCQNVWQIGQPRLKALVQQHVQQKRHLDQVSNWAPLPAALRPQPRISNRPESDQVDRPAPALLDAPPDPVRPPLPVAVLGVLRLSPCLEFDADSRTVRCLACTAAFEADHRLRSHIVEHLETDRHKRVAKSWLRRRIGNDGENSEALVADAADPIQARPEGRSPLVGQVSDGLQDLRAEILGGEEEEDRTPDLCIANAALSQLGYPHMRQILATSAARRLMFLRAQVVPPWRPRAAATVRK